MAKSGPKGIFSDEIQEKILDCIRKGNYIETAAAYAGINRDTFYRWMREGARDEKSIYHEFSKAVGVALAEAETHDLKIIGDAAKEYWQAAAWRLERRWPQRWARKEKIEHTGEGGGPIEVNREEKYHIIQEVITDPEIRERIRENYRQRVGTGTSENRL